VYQRWRRATNPYGFFRPKEFSRVGFTADFFGLDLAHLRPAWDADIARQSVEGGRTLTDFLKDFFVSEGLRWPPPPETLERYDRECGRYQDQALLNPIPSERDSTATRRTRPRGDVGIFAR